MNNRQPPSSPQFLSKSRQARDEDPWVGRVFDFSVDRVANDTCFLKLSDHAEAKLLQEDSLAHRVHGKTLADLPAYQPGRTVHVFVTHSRREDGRTVYFVNERWGHANPWPEMDEWEWLRDGDVVTGTVTHFFPSGDGQRYLVALDPTLPVLDTAGGRWNWPDDHPSRAGQTILQPDLSVTVTSEELPMGNPDPRGNEERLALEVGDPVRLIVLDASRRPPFYPIASLSRLINSRDAADATAASADKRVASEKIPARLATPAEFKQALLGRRIALVEDSEPLRQSFQTLLESHGAQVFTLSSPSGFWNAALLSRVLTGFLSQETCDLLLVDDGLPEAHVGERGLFYALRKLREKREAHAGEQVSHSLPRIALMSNLTETTEESTETLRQLGVFATLRRPLVLQTLARLLAPDAEPVWEWRAPEEIKDAVHSGLPKLSVSGLHHLLHKARKVLVQDYAVLLAVRENGQLRWVDAAGNPPFAAADCAQLFQTTELRLLAREQRTELEIRPTDKTSALHPHSHHRARWAALHFTRHGRPSYLLGVGSHRALDCLTAWPWLVEAARAEMQTLALQQLLTQHAEALASGWLAQGFAHESTTLGEELLNNARTLRQVLARAEAAPVSAQKIQPLAELLESGAERGIAMSQRLLRRHRARSEPVNLPGWLAALSPSLEKQCGEVGVALRIDPVPPVHLHFPEWVLTVALGNLVLNAVKHHFQWSDNRWVRLRFQYLVDPARLRIEVEDNGPGLSVATRAHLFEPGLSTARDPAQRHGIGLWLSRVLLEKEHGRLELVASYRGFGTTFRLELPIYLESPNPNPIARDHHP